ncbi:hypothetical protein [Azospirillum himalayense]|uniref:Replication initiation protein n=1 Tax=Azospirillum himalayense TaxID=654847 RepID=A0ABW0G8E1_9PROT
MSAGIQLKFPVELDPVEPRVLPGWGWWTLNRRLKGGGLAQKAYTLEKLDFVLGHVRRDVDTYMSQAFFTGPTRRAMHLAYATHAYVDLDTYRAERLRGLTAAQIAGLLVLHCRDEGIPLPTRIIGSGRGIYLKYFWSAPIPRAAAGRAVAVNRALVRLFSDFGADPAAVDMSRILRVIGTVNSKSGVVARVLWSHDQGGQPVTYDFDSFADEVLPYSLDQIREFRQRAEERRAEIRILSQEKARRRAQREAEERRRGSQRAFCREDWHWGVLEDLRTLAELRYPGGIVEPGQRDLFGHFGACQLAMVIPVGQLWHEVQAWARILLPADYVGGEFHRHTSSLLERAKRAAAGERDAQGRAPVWTYRKDRMIQQLRISGDEMGRMTRLIDDGEKRRRDREAWRAAHTGQSRAEYEGNAQHRAHQAKALRESGRTWGAVAAELGLPTPDAARLLALRAR